MQISSEQACITTQMEAANWIFLEFAYPRSQKQSRASPKYTIPYATVFGTAWTQSMSRFSLGWKTPHCYIYIWSHINVNRTSENCFSSICTTDPFNCQQPGPVLWHRPQMARHQNVRAPHQFGNMDWCCHQEMVISRIIIILAFRMRVQWGCLCPKLLMDWNGLQGGQ